MNLLLRSPGAEGPLILFVCGYTWSAVRMSIMLGPRRYFSLLWNWVEIIMLTLFGLTFLLWMKAAVQVDNDIPGYGKERMLKKKVKWAFTVTATSIYFLNSPIQPASTGINTIQRSWPKGHFASLPFSLTFASCFCVS